MEETQGQEGHDHQESGPGSVVGRSFRYMRRVPTIIEYKPPDGNLNFSIFFYGKVQLNTKTFFFVADDIEEEEEDIPKPIDRRAGAATSDVFILDRVAQKMAAEKQFGTKQLNLDKPKITKALSVDDSSHLRLTKPLDVRK